MMLGSYAMVREAQMVDGESPGSCSTAPRPHWTMLGASRAAGGRAGI